MSPNQKRDPVRALRFPVQLRVGQFLLEGTLRIAGPDQWAYDELRSLVESGEAPNLSTTFGDVLQSLQRSGGTLSLKFEGSPWFTTS